MTNSTADYAIPYYELGDPPNLADATQDLAERVAAILKNDLTLGAKLTVPSDLTVGGKLIMPNAIWSAAYTGTTDASGFLIVTHGAGFTPTSGWAFTTNPASSFAQPYGIDQLTSTTVRLRFGSVAANGALVSTAVAGRVFVVR